MIRKATHCDIAQVAQQYQDLLLYEKMHGSTTNWKLGIYPTQDTAEQAYAAGTLYVLETCNGLCASMILNHEQSSEYTEISWQYPAPPEQIFVIHTLCVPPAWAGHSFGSQMVQFAINHAAQAGGAAIRLDTWADNTPAAALYQKCGFRLAGSCPILLQGIIPEQQLFFERKLEDNHDH